MEILPTGRDDEVPPTGDSRGHHCGIFLEKLKVRSIGGRQGMAAFGSLPRGLAKAPLSTVSPRMATAVKVPQRLVEDPTVADYRNGPFPSSPYSLEGTVQELSAHSIGGLLQNRLPVPTEISIGGHRGMGMNRKLPHAELCSGAFRENTLQSFREAAANGASFVEFDVQVSKDGVPVIWHDDFAVTRSLGGQYNRTMIKELSVAEFKRLNELQLVRECHGVAEPLHWKCNAEHALPTLREVFRGVPESVGFDIEVKMTTPHHQACTSPEEVERVVTAIVAEVKSWDAVTYRRMIFSTFDPDVAIALKQQQSSIPVLFLSDGMTHYADLRRCGLPTAVAVAARHKLDGVVLEIAELRKVPELVATARRLGLYVLTYGVQNDNPTTVRLQQKWGVHAAIVDDVKGIVQNMHLPQRREQLNFY